MHFLSPASSMSDRSVILKMMTEKMSGFCNRENIFIWYLKVSYLWIHENISSQAKLMDDCNSLQKIKNIKISFTFLAFQLLKAENKRPSCLLEAMDYKKKLKRRLLNCIKNMLPKLKKLRNMVHSQVEKYISGSIKSCVRYIYCYFFIISPLFGHLWGFEMQC